MSDFHVRNLERVRDEYRATQASLAYILQNWHRQDVIEFVSAEENITHQYIKDSARHLEATYFVRLYARFEGILENHLLINHAGIPIPDNRRVGWLITKIERAERFRLGERLRREHDLAKDTRNDIAHGQTVLLMSFDDALTHLSRILRRLAEPLRKWT